MFRKAALALAVIVTAASGSAVAQTSFELVSRSDVAFQPLNPLRGDASPQAGVLWGDIKQNLATGTLVRFRDGFSSPPHIHNITYRAVVISGEVHNDDPEAAHLWMGPGSFWTQPAGETHITAAQGGDTTIFLEIMDGPYLVQPSKEAFDNGERPVNLEARNVVWLDPSDVTWVQHDYGSQGPELAFLWGQPKDGERNATFLRVPAGTGGTLNATGDWLRAVVVKGAVSHQQQGIAAETALEPGSYFGAPSGISHELSCTASIDCVFYITAKGKIAFVSR